jgi:hypothetical protein
MKKEMIHGLLNLFTHIASVYDDKSYSLSLSLSPRKNPYVSLSEKTFKREGGSPSLPPLLVPSS